MVGDEWHTATTVLAGWFRFCAVSDSSWITTMISARSTIIHRKDSTLREVTIGEAELKVCPTLMNQHYVSIAYAMV